MLTRVFGGRGGLPAGLTPRRRGGQTRFPAAAALARALCHGQRQGLTNTRVFCLFHLGAGPPRAGLTVPRCVPLVTSEVPTGHWDIIFRKCLVTSWNGQGRSPHFTLEGRLGVQRRGLRGPREMQRHPARALSSGSPSAASNPRSLPERPQLSPAPHRWGDRAEKGNDLPRFSRVELGEEARRGGWGHRAFISSSVVSGQGRKGGKERSTGTERTRGKQRQGLRLTPSHRRKRFLCVLSSSFFPSLCPNLP